MFQKFTIKPQKYIILPIFFFINYMKQTLFMVCVDSSVQNYVVLITSSHKTKIVQMIFIQKGLPLRNKLLISYIIKLNMDIYFNMIKVLKCKNILKIQNLVRVNICMT